MIAKSVNVQYEDLLQLLIWEEIKYLLWTLFVVFVFRGYKNEKIEL